jgi:leucyl-tRNA synthetase
MVYERYLPAVESGLKAQDKNKTSHREMRSLTHRTVRDVTKDMGEFAFNTAVSFIMELVNGIYHYTAEGGVDLEVLEEAVNSTLSLLAPFAPFICEELWGALGHEESIHTQPWPSYDEELARPDEVTLIVQVNGKVRDKMTVPAGISDDEMREKALACANARKFIGEKEIRKVIVVPGKLVSIVV